MSYYFRSNNPNDTNRYARQAITGISVDHESRSGSVFMIGYVHVVHDATPLRIPVYLREVRIPDVVDGRFYDDWVKSDMFYLEKMAVLDAVEDILA